MIDSFAGVKLILQEESFYPLGTKQSLEELAPIVKTLMEVKGNSLSETPIMLVGNKSDDNTVCFYSEIEPANKMREI
ncbi:hypothetical protein ANCDUO_17525 [Ancylostoma duodenale]|uniref:Ras family protein n=1 Tax=Ancylostoma duodenale TaxID=51022 RepID=A0A0C2G0F4_9BILA|nr:hypothetical protein ANCDUO_17525 [Ancylostoma duodenale]